MKRMFAWCVPLLCLFIISCQKDPLEHLTEEESRIYITNYDTSAQFRNYQTFSIVDSVAVIRNNQLQGRQQAAVDVQFINAISSALQARGFVRVARSQNPDLGVAVSRIVNTSTNVVSYNDYGGYYGGYWDPYYWNYPGYNYYFPTYYGVYQSSETLLMTDIFDLKNAQQNAQLRAIWSGMVRGTGVFDASNVQSQVSALFSQSPYLGRQ